MPRPTPVLSIAGATYHMDADGRYPIFVDGKLAAWAWRAGREFGVDHGDLALADALGVPKVIAAHDASVTYLDADGNPLAEDDFLPVDVIDFAQQLKLTMPGLASYQLRRVDAPLRDFMLDGGPPLDEVPLDKLAAFERWGPIPDPEDADKTGSGRLKVQRHPTAMAIFIRDLMLDAGPTVPQLEDLDRWIFDQGMRGYHLFAYQGPPHGIEQRASYTGDDAVPFGDFLNYSAHGSRNYKPDGADAGNLPGIVVGQGYREKGGGCSSLFKRALPDGVTWARSGLTTGSALHMTIDALVFGALCTNSKSAADSAVAHFEAVSSFLWSGENVTSRGWGLMFKAVAYLAPLMRYRDARERVSLFRSADEAIARLTALNKNGMPAPDNGKTIEGGHLTGEEVYNSLGAVIAQMFPNMSDDEIKALCSKGAESDAGFYAALLATGLDDWIDIWDRFEFWDKHPDGAGAGQSMRKAAMHQLRYAANFLVNVIPKPHVDIHKGFTGGKRVPKGGLWSDVGTNFGLAEGGDDGNDIKGTKVRMDIGGIARVCRTLNMPDAMITTHTVLGICNAAKWWNGDDPTKAMLEFLWPLGHFYGWDGTFAIEEPQPGGKLKAQTVIFSPGDGA